MRRLLACLACLVYLLPFALAQASDVPGKIIKATPKDKEETIIDPPKEETSKKPAKLNTKAAEAARQKEEEQAADNLATKIAERISALKIREAAAKANGRPIPRPISKKVEGADKEKTSATINANDVHWSYEGDTGPLAWGKLHPSFAKCDSGERQSPIDIRDGIKVELDPLNFEYKSLPFNVIDNGHTIQVNVADGNFINVSGRTYALVQMHFHKPAEERVNGKSFEMVAHLVHRDADGKLAIVAILMEMGKPNSGIQLVWNNWPLEKNTSVRALNAIDLNTLLPASRDYATYIGSLTEPPCTEGVLWLVMKEPIEISTEQLAIFNRQYPANARPLQKISGRLIKESREPKEAR
ncbi:MAG: carbonic anhydrase family protein [Burkholderiaceae bacterium]|nr:carbonic anhydrase family protein [Burkholderiaceae bacterium]